MSYFWMLNEHALDSYFSTIKLSLEHTSSTWSFSKDLCCIKLYLSRLNWLLFSKLALIRHHNMLFPLFIHVFLCQSPFHLISWSSKLINGRVDILLKLYIMTLQLILSEIFLTICSWLLLQILLNDGISILIDAKLILLLS